MAAFDKLSKASFAGFVFPVTDTTVTGGMRDHVHEYPHSPGGAPEKLGRKLYEIKMKVPCMQGFPAYPKLWPETAASLRIIFEGGRTFSLLIPTIGEIDAYCTSWVETSDAKSNRNGVMFELTFREDQTDQFLVDKLITQSVDGLKSAVQDFSQALTDLLARRAEALTQVTAPDFILIAPIPPEDLSLLNQILAVGLQIDAALLQAEYYGNLISDLALTLASLCLSADTTSATLNEPVNHALLTAHHNVWRQAQKLAADALRQQVRVVKYVVPQTMSVTDVSKAIYGDNSHAVDILRTNAIRNAFAIPQGTVIKAYVFTDQQVAA